LLGIERLLTKKNKKKAKPLAGAASKAKRNGINDGMRVGCVYAVVPCFAFCDGLSKPATFAGFFELTTIL
jgi:hypothetical protein